MALLVESSELRPAIIGNGIHGLRRVITQIHAKRIFLAGGQLPFHTNADQDVFLLGLAMGQLADHPILPQQVEFRHRQGGEVGQHHLNALGTSAFGSMKLVHTKLPDRQRLEDRALAAVIAPDQKIKSREIVDLLAHAFEIFQGQARNHFSVSVF